MISDIFLIFQLVLPAENQLVLKQNVHDSMCVEFYTLTAGP